MHRLFLFLFIVALFAIPVYVHAESINCEIYVITAPVALNLREGPGTNYKVVTSVNAGEQVVAYETIPASDGKSWYRVKFKKYTGWASSTYVKPTGQFSSECNQDVQLEEPEIVNQVSTNTISLPFTTDVSHSLVIGVVMMLGVILLFVAIVYIVKVIIIPFIRRVVIPIILIAGAGYVAINLIALFYGSPSEVTNNPGTVQIVKSGPVEPFFGLALFVFIIAMFIVVWILLSLSKNESGITSGAQRLRPILHTEDVETEHDAQREREEYQKQKTEEADLAREKAEEAHLAQIKADEERKEKEEEDYWIWKEANDDRLEAIEKAQEKADRQRKEGEEYNRKLHERWEQERKEGEEYNKNHSAGLW